VRGWGIGWRGGQACTPQSAEEHTRTEVDEADRDRDPVATEADDDDAVAGCAADRDPVATEADDDDAVAGCAARAFSKGCN
jgi:hypothetical protein